MKSFSEISFLAWNVVNIFWIQNGIYLELYMFLWIMYYFKSCIPRIKIFWTRSNVDRFQQTLFHTSKTSILSFVRYFVNSPYAHDLPARRSKNCSTKDINRYNLKHDKPQINDHSHWKPCDREQPLIEFSSSALEFLTRETVLNGFLKNQNINTFFLDIIFTKEMMPRCWQWSLMFEMGNHIKKHSL
jgi:hypothetical protein